MNDIPRGNFRVKGVAPVFFVDTIELEGLGNRSYLAGGEQAAVAFDPPRDIDQVLAAAARRGVRITHVAETHIHNDYITGGLELARITGAVYLVPAAARVSFARTPVTDGDTVDVDTDLTLTAVSTPGHTRTTPPTSSARRPGLWPRSPVAPSSSARWAGRTWSNRG